MSKLTRNKRGGAFALVLVILIIVGIVLIIPAIASGEGLDGALDGISQWINDLLGGFTGQSDGFLGVGFTVHYIDGTSEDFGASPTFSISPLSITVTGKEVTEIDVFVRGKMTAENVGAWTSEITQQIELYHKPETIPKYSSTGFFSETGSSWAPDTVKSLASTSLSATVIDQLVSVYGTGNWLMQVNVSADLEMTIDGVDTTFAGIAPSGGIDFKYSSTTEPPDDFSIKTTTAPIS